jgi:hypothetical protein
MRRRILIGALVAGAALAAGHGAAIAQTSPEVVPPLGPSPEAAPVYGTRYYPGIGFRYALPPSERVYGYYRGPRVYGYSRGPRVHGHKRRAGDWWWCPW